MALKSAWEDLTENTLRTISGLLRKLDYLSELRQADGSYMHWGLTRVYGETATQQALAEAHQVLVSQILRTSLHDLLDDAVAASRSEQVTPTFDLERLRHRGPGLFPPNPLAGSELHLSSVLLALSSLTKHRLLHSHPVS
jgi:hypothetical protein